MRYLLFLTLTLAALAWWACHTETPTSTTYRTISHEAAPWRRTAHGWERCEWLIPKRAAPSESVHPLTFTAALLAVALGLAAWPQRRASEATKFDEAVGVQRWDLAVRTEHATHGSHFEMPPIPSPAGPPANWAEPGIRGYPADRASGRPLW